MHSSKRRKQVDLRDFGKHENIRVRVKHNVGLFFVFCQATFTKQRFNQTSWIDFPEMNSDMQWVSVLYNPYILCPLKTFIVV